MAPKGYLALVLHAHLPFVRHPEHEQFLEEDWLYEAITETYLPLLGIMEGWERDGVNWRLTMSLTPTLCSMLSDDLLQQRYLRHIERLIELADLEVQRTATMPEFNRTALMYRHRFAECRDAYENGYGRDLCAAFRRFMEAGKLEIVTCGATHGFLPLMRERPEAVEAQIAVAADHYRRTFGRGPAGIWNAECGYFPGVEDVLARHGIQYFFVDSHGVLFGSKRPRWGVFAPVTTAAGVAAFGRDQESSRSVWSAELGYPGDPRYREFYRDIGFDLDLEYIRPYIHDSGLRTATGIKYHRITGNKVPLRDKLPYNEADAQEAAASHAGHFLFCRQQQVLHLSGLMENRPPIVVSPYDAELFGHWWYEGPRFLDFLVRKIHFDQSDLALTTPREYLERHGEGLQVSVPSMSSWGFGGFNEVWLEGSNDWVYRHLDEAALRMAELAGDNPSPDHLTRRALNQAARELLLAQASDWAFIMKTNTVVDYAIKRTKTHIAEFLALDEMIRTRTIDEHRVEGLEWKDNIFPHIDYSVYAPKAAHAGV